ncbi:MAG: aspartate/glutamate racemase family protein [Dehalococcoidia bacterium]
MKIALVHITQIPDEFVGPWFGMVQSSFKNVLRPDTEVVLRPIKRGLRGDNVLDFDNPYFSLLDRREIIEAFIEADREGFDAGCVHCFGDPGISEGRAVVGMPLFGPAESALHFACQLGKRFAIIGTNMPGQLEQLSAQVREHGLQERLIPDGIRFEEEPFADSFDKWMANPQLCADSVAGVARGCVEDGADVIVLGCAGSSMFCSMVGFNQLEVGNQRVPVIDSVMIALKTAEMAVDIKHGTGLPIPSRTRNYVLPGSEDWTRVRNAFDLPS